MATYRAAICSTTMNPLARYSILATLVSAAFLGITFSAGAAEPAPAKDARPGLFVAVGYGGRRMSSLDGITWQNVQQWAQKGEDDSNNLISIAYGKGKFVAVGGGGWSRDSQAGHVLVTTDGATWREVKKMPFRIAPIMFEGGRFVAGAPDHQVIWSDDGETWNLGAKIEVSKEIPGWAIWFRRGVAGNGTFVFTGNANKDQKTWWCLTTHDGQSVASFATDLPEVKGLAFGAGKFLLTSTDGVHTSPDGKTWKLEPASPTDKLGNVVWTGKEFFLSGKQGTYTSPDGVSWTPFGTKPIPCNVVWSDGKLFIGTGWPGKMWSSTDGQKWTQGLQPLPPMGVNQIVYGVPQ